MITQQFDMLTQIITQNRPSTQSTKNSDNNDDTFKDMLDNKNQESTSVKEEPTKNESMENATDETSDTEDTVAKQTLLANLLFAQSTTPIQNQMSQQSTAISAEQIIEPIVQEQTAQNMQSMDSIQNMNANPNSELQQIEIPVQNEQVEQTNIQQINVEQANVKADVETDVKVEQNTTETAQSKIETTAKTTENTGENTQDMMHSKTSETDNNNAEQPELKQAEVQDAALFKNIETTPVKVGEKAPVLDTQSPNVEQDLQDIIKYNLKADGDKIEIQLNPSNLGKITVELVQKDGSMSVLVTAENSKTLSLLAQHAGGIETMMQERLAQPVQVFVEQQQPEGQFNDSQKQNNQQNQNNKDNKPSKDEQQTFIDQLRLGLYNIG